MPSATGLYSHLRNIPQSRQQHVKTSGRRVNLYRCVGVLCIGYRVHSHRAAAWPAFP